MKVFNIAVTVVLGEFSNFRHFRKKYCMLVCLSVYVCMSGRQMNIDTTV